MDYKNLNISEFAALAETTVRTIKYYEELGLFRPDHVESNGYRKYTAYQLDDYYAIITLQENGMSLEEIKDYLANPSFEASYDSLLLQEDIIKHKISELKQRERVIKVQKQFLDDYQAIGENKVYIRPNKLKSYYVDTTFENLKEGTQIIVVRTVLNNTINGLILNKTNEFIKSFNIPLNGAKGNGEFISVDSDYEIGLYCHGDVLETIKEQRLINKIENYVLENGYQSNGEYLMKVIYEDKEHTIFNLYCFAKRIEK